MNAASPTFDLLSEALRQSRLDQQCPAARFCDLWLIWINVGGIMGVPSLMAWKATR